MKTIFLSTVSILILISNINAETIQSPDGNIEADFTIQQGVLEYQLSYKDETIVASSPLSLSIKELPQLFGDVEITDTHSTSHDSTWQPVYGEQAEYRDHYNEMILTLHSEEADYSFKLIARAYNEGLAFCYAFPGDEPLTELTIDQESSTFTFDNNYTTWATYSAQGLYETTTLSQIKNGCERPLVIQMQDDLFVALAEARLVDYARMKLSPADHPNQLVSDLASAVTLPLPFSTPWRVVMVAESPGKLLENNFILLNLNEPCAIKDMSWIRPGKVIREVTLTTQGGKDCVDFAVANNFQFVEYDAGWYGHEYDDASDATTVTLDPDRSKGPLDLHEVIDYAHQNGIGIIVYVNRRALEKQLDEILPLYQQWGIDGLKYGFVNVGSQEWTQWLHEAVRKAADHEFMVDIHDEYRPTGYSRSYPNLMTQEGIRGDETRPTNEQTLTTLFTRMIAGAGDNTICYYDDRVDNNASHAYQLAKAVCFYSPWQFVYWYDRPAEINQEHDHGQDFFKEVPTVWDETKVLDGTIGDYAIIARRSGDDWFLGCMNSDTERSVDIAYSFLDEGKQYKATIYTDDPSLQTRTDVKVEERIVDSQDSFNTTVFQNTGFAIYFAAP